MNSTIHKYWNSLGMLPKELYGCYPMGGGGLLEAPYRHFFEVKHLQRIIPLNKDMNILELGCGNGRWAVSLAPLVNHYTGIDFSETAIDIARECIKDIGLDNIVFYKIPAMEFQADKYFDIIYFSGVTQYLQDDEIIKILSNLKPYLKQSTIIIDRSTLNYKTREISDLQNYYSIYRTPHELSELFNTFEFKKYYQQRSYRFLRGVRFLNRTPVINALCIVSDLAKPISYYLMYTISWIADHINPIPFEGGNRSHDFILFKRSEG
ncbi:class I SAM-dependent methyltransferase [Methylomonas sp. LL1]|uniref:class I SAM-dependent methyltransferase n=1 Tax=Methylomonas sp. LL1 TaxID=2785785 RepID=UPI0018C3640B|nr:class I SAM-dependent methyltransferase [Methylomonas sp. LL1]QPK63430.1 class I SAM-dependent methyltransferase [Methylomonas sp. LL1]